MTVAVFLALTAGPTAFAQPGRGRFPGANFEFSALDTNHDGVLDDKEIDAATITFAKLDKNADGQITPDEVRAATPEGCRRVWTAAAAGRRADRATIAPRTSSKY